ncbi:hypothetical protein Hanom_Chr06g00479891 [Helianthus anomalus]
MRPSSAVADSNLLDSPGDQPLASENEFMDEEAIFGMPNLLADMAEGMLMTPPRQPGTDDFSPNDASDCDNLWNY